MGVNNFKVGDTVRYKWNTLFVGKVMKLLEDNTYGVYWEMGSKNYTFLLEPNKDYHTKMDDCNLGLVKKAQVEYPEDGTWV